MTWIEATAVFFGVLCVVLTIRQSIWCWPTGLVQVLLFIYIFYEVRLYSDLILHVIYVFLQVYGWYHWLHGGRDRDTLRVSRSALGVILGWVAAVIGGSLLLGFVMASSTDASVPYGDAFTTVASLVAQWLLARKCLESWAFWITIDVVAIGIYWHKELFLTAGLYSVFLVLAVAGFIAWRRSMSRSLSQAVTT